MKVKDLKKMLSEIGDDCDEFPVLVWIERLSEEEGGENLYMELDENAWSLGGRTKETSFVEIEAGKKIIKS